MHWRSSFSCQWRFWPTCSPGRPARAPRQPSNAGAKLTLRRTWAAPCQRMAQVLGLRFAMLEPETVVASAHQSAIPLRDGDVPLGTLLVPADLPKPMAHLLHRLVPSLEALLAAARDRKVMNTELE